MAIISILSVSVSLETDIMDLNIFLDFLPPPSCWLQAGAIIKCFMLPVLCCVWLELSGAGAGGHKTYWTLHLASQPSAGPCLRCPACCSADYCNLFMVFTVATDNIHPAIVITRNIDGRKYNSDNLQQNVFTITGGPINTQARSDQSCSHYQYCVAVPGPAAVQWRGQGEAQPYI